MAQSIFDVDLQLSNEYAELIEELSKFSVIVIFYHLVGNFSRGLGLMISDDAVDALVLILLGVCFYHLIFKKLIKVNYKEGMCTSC